MKNPVRLKRDLMDRDRYGG